MSNDSALACDALNLQVDAIGSRWTKADGPGLRPLVQAKTGSALASAIQKGRYLDGTQLAQVKTLFDGDVHFNDRLKIGKNHYRPVGTLQSYCRDSQKRCISRRDVLEAQRDAMRECLNKDYEGNCQNMLENLYMSLDELLTLEHNKEKWTIVGLAVVTLAMSITSTSAHFASSDVRSPHTWKAWRAWFLIATLLLKVAKLGFAMNHGNELVSEWKKIHDQTHLLGTEKKIPKEFNLQPKGSSDTIFKNTNRTIISGIRETHFVKWNKNTYVPYRPHGNLIAVLISAAVFFNAGVALYDAVFHSEAKVFVLRPEDEPPSSIPAKHRKVLKRLRSVRKALEVGCPLLALLCTVLYARGDKFVIQGFPKLEGAIRLLSNNYVVGLVCLLMWSASVGLGSVEKGVPRIDTLQVRIGLLTLAIVDLGTSLHVMNTYKCHTSRTSGLFDF